jgi:hypothetical protein
MIANIEIKNEKTSQVGVKTVPPGCFPISYIIIIYESDLNLC